MSDEGSAADEPADAVYQTPTAIVLEETADHPELDPPTQEDLGASPELVGPVTRSGRKRKNSAPVKSAGKKKNKMTSRTPPKAGSQAESNNPAPKAPDNDLVALLTGGLSDIKQSMAGMEDRLAGKIDSLEASVNKNKQSTVILTESVNKNTVDLARLESQIRGGMKRHLRTECWTSFGRLPRAIGP